MSVQLPDYSNTYFRTMASQTPYAASQDSAPQPRTNSRDEDPGNKEDTGKTDESSGSGDVIDAVFGDPSDKNVSMEDFLTLMVAQLKNQDFMNPMDDTQYITQLAQISTMQQMEEMSYNAKSTYVTSLVGKTVTAAKFSVSGELKKATGVVDKISLLDGKFVIYVGKESYDLDQIMEVKTEAQAELEKGEENQNKPGDEKPGDNKPGDDDPKE